GRQVPKPAIMAEGMAPDPLAAVERQAAIEVVEQVPAMRPEQRGIDLRDIGRAQYRHSEAADEEQRAHPLRRYGAGVAAPQRLELARRQKVDGRSHAKRDPAAAW